MSSGEESVKVKLESAEWAAVRPMIAARKTAGMAWAYGCSFYDDPCAGYSTVGDSKSVVPYLGCETPELEELIDNAVAEPNDEQRLKLEWQMGQYVYGNYLIVPIAVTNGLWGLSNRVGDWVCPKGAGRLTNWGSITHGPGFKP